MTADLQTWSRPTSSICSSFFCTFLCSRVKVYSSVWAALVADGPEFTATEKGWALGRFQLVPEPGHQWLDAGYNWKLKVGSIKKHVDQQSYRVVCPQLQRTGSPLTSIHPRSTWASWVLASGMDRCCLNRSVLAAPARWASLEAWHADSSGVMDHHATMVYSKQHNMILSKIISSKKQQNIHISFR